MRLSYSPANSLTTMYVVEPMKRTTGRVERSAMRAPRRRRRYSRARPATENSTKAMYPLTAFGAPLLFAVGVAELYDRD